MKILICGDSFAADWRPKYPDAIGWPNILECQHQVTNAAQAGCSEYRIYQQLKNHDLQLFDCVIVSHTSPFRIYTDYNPRHQDTLHHHCDLLYEDVCEISKHDRDFQAAKIFFEKFFSLEHATFVYKLIRNEINQCLESHRSLQIGHMLNPLSVDIDFSPIWNSHRGHINHYTDTGNYLVWQKITEALTHD